jgi:hypothetical protein
MGYIVLLEARMGCKAHFRPIEAKGVPQKLYNDLNYIMRVFFGRIERKIEIAIGWLE